MCLLVIPHTAVSQAKRHLVASGTSCKEHLCLHPEQLWVPVLAARIAHPPSPRRRCHQCPVQGTGAVEGEARPSLSASSQVHPRKKVSLAGLMGTKTGETG